MNSVLIGVVWHRKEMADLTKACHCIPVALISTDATTMDLAAAIARYVGGMR